MSSDEIISMSSEKSIVMTSEELSKFYKEYKKRLPEPDYTDRTTPHDGIIVAEGTNFYINIKEVSGWSQYLNNSFEDVKDNCKTIFDRPILHLPEIKSKKIEDVLHLMYGDVENNKNTFSEVQLESFVALSFSLCAPAILNRSKDYIHANFEKLDKIKLLDIGCDYDLTEIKKLSLDIISQNLFEYDLIRLIPVAFNHRLETLKREIRAAIFALKPLPGSQCSHEHCRACRNGKEPICPRNLNGMLYNPLIFTNIEQIAKLPREIKNYITHSIQ